MRLPAAALALAFAGTFGTASGASARQTSADSTSPAYIHAQWTVDDGLPANNVTGIVQDSAGYLWVATLQGLARFDGVRFTVLTAAGSGLPSDRIRTLVRGPDDALWMVTDQNLLARLRRGVVTVFGPDRGLPDRMVRTAHVDRGGAVWAATFEGVYRLAGDRFERVAPEIRDTVWSIAEGPDGEILIGTSREGVYRIAGERVTSLRASGGRPFPRVNAILPDPDGTLWIGTREGLREWRDADTVAAVPESGSGASIVPEVGDIRAASRTGDLWFAAADGVWRLDGEGLRNVAPRTGPGFPSLRIGPDDRAWYSVRGTLYRDGQPVFRLPDPGPDDVSANRQVDNFVWDREGNLWIATVRYGLFRLRPAAVRVVGVPEGLLDRNATVFAEDGTGAVLAGSRGGGVARIADGMATRWGLGQDIPPSVTALLRDSSGVVWVGGIRGLIVCTERPVVCGPPPGGLPPDLGTVHALHQDAGGRIWAGTDRGLLRYADGARSELATGIPRATAVRAFLERADGTLFMATNGAGVLAWRDGGFSRIDETDGLPTGFVRSLFLDAHGHLWVGTEGYGLARITLAGTDGEVSAASIEVIGQQDGLPDNVIHRILEDGDGRIWLSTNRGLGRVRLESLEAFADGASPLVNATVYTERDGLRNREANGGVFPSAIRTRDGRLWFATQNGVAIVDPDAIPAETAPPPVAIERIVTPGRTIASNGPIDLGTEERDFEIDYTALRLADPENVRFRYRLEGLNPAWTEAGSRRTAYFTQVPPGDYTFRVTASSAEGVWNEPGAALPLRVEPRFQETTTAKLLLALFAVSLLVAGFQWRIHALRARERELTTLVDARTADLRRHERQLEEQNARLAELDQAKSRLFTNLSHEFRTPLTLILGPLRGLLDGRHGELPPAARQQGDLILRNGRRLLRLVNQVLDLSRLEAGHVALDPRPGDLVAFARATTLAFSPLAERRRTDLRFRSDRPSIPLSFDREQLEKVLLNLLSNALKFTHEGGAVDVAVTGRDGVAEIAVRDTGIGIAAEELPHVFDRFHQASRSDTRRYEGSGIGLALARELVELHGGEIRAESSPGEGSTFTVRLPWTMPADGAAAATGAGESDGAPSSTQRVFEPEDHAEPDAPPTPEPADPGEDRTTILIVEDNADVRAYVRSILAPAYRVLEAANGRIGLDRAREALPDLIVADVMMPELDGLALGRALKDDPMTDAIPVVLLTAKAEAEDRVEGLRTGADAYLVKPFDPDVLEAQVANLLEQRRRLRERFRSGEATRPEPAVVAPAPSALDLRLRPILEDHLHDPGFGPNELAAAADLSYHQMYRALRAELDTTPSRYIRTVRVECAAALLSRRAGSITEIAYSVGFDSLSYFNRSYRERFDVAPSRHLGADVPV